jgi:aromatic-L-amino-acid/L-tryptophan decarboxylase
MTTVPGPGAETRGALDPEQTSGLADMDVEAFRRAGHDVVDRIADYLATIERHPVFPNVEPGSVSPLFALDPPEGPEPIETILADYSRLVEPNVTHWQHPGFMAYFPTTASGAGILGEMLTAGIGSNAMLWRTGSGWPWACPRRSTGS